MIDDKFLHLCNSGNSMNMKKITSLFAAFVLFHGIIIGQSGELLIQSGSKGFFIEHKVAPKENFYSIGRLFNVHPKHIAAFNNLDMTKGLAIDQSLMIPVTDTNFSQSVNSGVPVYYVVGAGEGLMAVSNKNNKVTLSNLRRWNGLSGDQVTVGKKLIVGFLITNEMQDKVVTITATQTENVKTAPVEEKKEVIAEVKQPEPEIKKPEAPAVKEEPKKTEPVEVKTETKKNFEGTGYFKNDFERQLKKYPLSEEIMATSGIFKTTTGWEDAKYYLLIDQVEPGTIVKITNPSNSKTVYAKVLYGMEGIRQNQGLDIRISNAAAAALDITEQDKFIVQVNY